MALQILDLMLELLLELVHGGGGKSVWGKEGEGKRLVL